VDNLTSRYNAAKEHVRGELAAVFKEQFYSSSKSTWCVNDLKDTIKLAKLNIKKNENKKPNAMQTSA
jgi:hypothetical protein